MKLTIFYCCLSIVVLVYGQKLSKSQMDEVDYDLSLYFRSMNRVADFFLAHKYYIDVIVHIGTFFENVNLKKVLRDKGQRLPGGIKAQLENLLRKHNKIIAYYNRMFEQHPHRHSKYYRNLTSLFNEEVWLDSVENFHDPLGKNREPFLYYDQKYFRKRYSNWDKYMDDIRDTNKKGTPIVEESDSCMLSVATNPINYSSDDKECDIREFCRQFMYRGTDLGYSLTHRLLILLVANNGRRCHVISPKDDRRFKNKFCADIYTESVFIEMNNYNVMDLFAEQILFCTLDGHSEFVKRHWLTELLSLQTKEGCFPENRNNSDALKVAAKNKRSKHSMRKWVINNITKDKIGRFLMLEGRCNGHTTTLVAGALSSAVRFLLEKFY